MSEEIRTTSASGGQKGVKPERHSLLPKQGLDAIARVFAFGATKYAADNWRRGYEWSKSFDALERHIRAFWDGETNDEESGEPHLAHAGFHILVLLTWLAEQGEGASNAYDDRWPASMGRARLAEADEEMTYGNYSCSEEDIEFPDGGRTVKLYTAETLPEPYTDSEIGLVRQVEGEIVEEHGPSEWDRSWPHLESLGPLQDSLNRMAARMAIEREGRAFIKEAPAPAEINPHDWPIIGWADPAPMTIAFRRTSLEAIRLACGLPLREPTPICDALVAEGVGSPSIVKSWLDDYDAAQQCGAFPIRFMSRVERPTTAAQMLHEAWNDERRT